MRKLLLTALALGTSLWAAADTIHVITDFQASAPLQVRKPFMNDSIDPKGQPFKASAPLASKVSHAVLDRGAAAPAADTTGTITFTLPANDGSLQLLRTRIRSERFAKGTLRITSPVAFKATLDGNDIITKESVQKDSITPASTSTAKLRLEPEHDATLLVTLLSYATDSVTPTVKVEFVPEGSFEAVPFHSGAEMKRRFALDDTEYGPRVSRMSMSPDGRYLITYHYNNYNRDRRRSYATLTDLQTGKVINENLPEYVNWMPRGKQLYYCATAADGYDLIMVDPLTGAQTVAAEGMPVNQFSWSPTEDYLIYSKYDEPQSESGPLRRYASPDDRQPGNRNRWSLVKYTPATGVAEQITFGNHTASLADISPDGKRIIVRTQQDNPQRRPFYDATFYELDLATLQADTLVPAGPAFVNSAEYSPDGTKVLFAGSPAAFDGIGMNCAPHPIANDYDIQLFLMDLATREVKPLTRDFDPSVKSTFWCAADGQIYLIGEAGFGNQLYSLNPATGAITKLPAQIDNVNSMTMGRDSARRLAYMGHGYEYAGRSYILDLKSGKSTLHADPRAERLDEIQLGKVDPWQFTTEDGTVIDGVICYPPDFDPEKKYPLIVYYYGGTSPTQRSLTQPYTPQLFASRDYVVYVLNPSGTTGYGQEFSARHVNAWGKRTAQEIIEGVTKFCEAHPFVDSSKIGCLGASYGGFMTQYLQTLTDKFAAAVSHAGISNVTSYWGEGYWGYSYNSVAAADSYPWSDADLFTKQGSLFNADKIHTPLLLLHGTADTNVPIGESIQLFNALRILGRPVEFISVDGENHFISDYPKRILWQNSIMAWFEKWLHDDPSWWNDLYPERHL